MRCQQPVRLAEGVGAVAGPAVLGGIRHHVGAHVVLLGPAKPVAGQSLVVVANQVLQANVAGLGQEHRADADRQILDTGLRLADMGEAVRKSGALVDLQE